MPLIPDTLTLTEDPELLDVTRWRKTASLDTLGLWDITAEIDAYPEFTHVVARDLYEAQADLILTRVQQWDRIKRTLALALEALERLGESSPSLRGLLLAMEECEADLPVSGY